VSSYHNSYRGGRDSAQRPYRRRVPEGDLGPVAVRVRPSRMPPGWILGVCAWLARYFAVETWVVRVIAVTVLLFLPSVILPAYIIGGIVLRLHYRWERDHRRHSTSAADHLIDGEFGLDPVLALRNTDARMRQLELKLRRMEAHVTSSHFELQREFNRIDR
jgi:phage shock protein C